MIWMGNLSIKLKTSVSTAIYVLLVLLFSISFTAYSFKEKLLHEKVSSLEENIINLSESYKESVITLNLEKIDELIGFLLKTKAVKGSFVEDDDGKVIGGSDIRYLGLKDPDFSPMDIKFSKFVYNLKVDNFTVGKVVVFYDKTFLEKEVISDIRKVVTPLLYVVGFIMFASFLGTFFISSVLVSPLISLKHRITELMSDGFIIQQTAPPEYTKKIECPENITDMCWLFSKDPYSNLSSIPADASKTCTRCEIFKENSGDEIQQLSFSFYIMVASLNNFIQKLEEVHKERETLSCMAAMGEMSARLAHEIKNALYSISNAANYIKQNTDDKTIRDFGRDR